MNEDIKRIAALIGSVELDTIRLVEASFKTEIRSPNDVGDVDICFDPVAKVASPLKDGVFCIEASAELKVVPRSKEKSSVVFIKAVYELKYMLPTEFKATKKDLELFAQHNGVFNVWPYWREFVQSSFQRMNLPPVILPVRRLAIRPAQRSVTGRKSSSPSLEGAAK